KSDQQWSNTEQGSGTDGGPVDPRLRCRKNSQSYGERAALYRVGHHQRPQEVVPVVTDRDQTIGQVSRLGQRYVDLEQNLHPAATFYPGGFFQLSRNGLEGLSQQKDPEGTGDIRQPDPRHGIDQAQATGDTVILDNQYLGKNE